ncbi:hypothetical protein Tco_1548982 [Tanacetum coccineum]
MTTLADKAILLGADNRPPMLENDMYDSWKSRMELYMMNRQHGRMILESVENGPLIWPSIEENGVTRPKKYSGLSATEAIQADCDVKATNIILQGLPLEVYALVSNHKVAKELWERIQLLMQGTSLTKQESEYALAEVHNLDNVDNNMINQGVQVMPSSEQSNVVNHSKTKITSVRHYNSLSVVCDRITSGSCSCFQNSFYLKKAQQLEPKLYDGNVIKNTSAIVICNSEETLMLAKENRSKLLLKQQDLMVLEKKVNTTPVDYANSMNSSCRPTKVEVPKELPKVSMSQEKDTVIRKLKERIKSLSGSINEDKVKKDIEEIETINIKLDHRVKWIHEKRQKPSKMDKTEHGMEMTVLIRPKSKNAKVRVITDEEQSIGTGTDEYYLECNLNPS